MARSSLVFASLVTLSLLFGGAGCAARTDVRQLPELPADRAPDFEGKPQPSAAPVRYGNMVLVATAPEGVAVVDFYDPIRHGADVKYRFRFVPAAGGPETRGEGEVAERWEPVTPQAQRTGGDHAQASRIMIREFRDAGSQTWVEAGPIRFEWSWRDASSGWIYFDPKRVRVRVARTGEFELLNLLPVVARVSESP